MTNPPQRRLEQLAGSQPPRVADPARLEAVQQHRPFDFREMSVHHQATFADKVRKEVQPKAFLFAVISDSTVDLNGRCVQKPLHEKLTADGRQSSCTRRRAPIKRFPRCERMFAGSTRAVGADGDMVIALSKSVRFSVVWCAPRVRARQPPVLQPTQKRKTHTKVGKIYPHDSPGPPSLPLLLPIGSVLGGRPV